MLMRAEDLAPDLLRGLHLARDLVGPVVRHVAVRARRAHAGAVGVVDGGLQLREHVVAHLVAAGAERLGVGQLQRGIEAAPEDDAGDEAAEHQKAEAEHRARPAQHVPDSTANASVRASDDGAALPSAALIGASRRRAAQQVSISTKSLLDRRLARRPAAHGTAVQKIAPRRDRGEELAVAVHEVGDR